MNTRSSKPTGVFIAASWAALFAGAGAFLLGLWNAGMQLNEKGYYFTVLMYGLFAAVSLILAIGLLGIGLWNATLELSEKGFYGISFLLSLFATISIQKNVRDLSPFQEEASVAES